MGPEVHAHLSDDARRAVYRLLLGVANADRRTTRAESAILEEHRAFFERLGWPLAQVQSLSAVSSLDQLTPEELAAVHGEPRAVARALATLANLGRLTPEEERYLTRLGAQLGADAEALIEEMIEQAQRLQALEVAAASTTRRLRIALASVAVLALLLLASLLHASRQRELLGAELAAEWSHANRELAARLERSIFHVRTTCKLVPPADSGVPPHDSSRQGTAFLASGGYLLSARHVLFPCQFLGDDKRGYTCDGHTHRISHAGRLLLDTARTPLPLLVAPPSTGPDGRTAAPDLAAFLVRDHPDFTHPALEFAPDPPKLHDPVVLAGHGTGKPAEVVHVTGHLTLLGASTLHISAPLLHGMSGSPVITPSLHLLALATHSPRDSDSTVALVLSPQSEALVEDD